MSSSRGPSNEIAQIETRSLAPSATAIMASLNMNDRATADAFVKEVLHRILLQRMTSPPDTALLCVTVVGSFTAREFAALWRKHVAAEPAMQAFLERMERADVLHGTPQGKILEQISVLEGQ